MRLPAFTDRGTRLPLQWVMFALLSAIGTAPLASWQCSTLPNGLWECVSATPPPEIVPADDSTVTPADTDTGDDPIVAPVPADTELFSPDTPDT
ncbi:MAG: hypothetical protein KAJ65_01735, partial [Gammaproteobacteria bacterium]|nr:hypothetical protein [Gammaproteobacteria bacterium]